MDPEDTAREVYGLEEARDPIKARDLQARFMEQAQGDDWEDFLAAMALLERYGVC